MADAVVTPIEAALTVQYETTEEQIALLGASLKGVTFGTPEDYKNGVKHIAQVRGLRTAVEKRRKELKADSVAYGKRVDAAAHKLTDLIEAIEAPLLAGKKAVDDEEARLKLEKERADIIALEAENTRKREAAEAAARVAREADEKRIAEAAAKLAADQARAAEANKAIAEQQRIESERLALEKKKIDAQQSAVAAQQAEIERQAKEAARIGAERCQREEAERQAIADAETARVEAARLEAMKPEIERVRGFAVSVRAFALTLPELQSIECQKAIGWAAGMLAKVATGLEKFNGKVGA